MCTSAPPSSSAVTSCPVAAFTSGGPPMKIVPVPRTITVSSDMAGTYAPPAVHEPMTDGDLRDPEGRHARLVEEDPPEVVAVGEDLRLERQERAARVDEVDAREAVLERDFLRPEVLLDREREVRAALHGRVVRDDDALASLDDADAGNDPCRGRLPLVEIPGGERVQLEERRAGIDEPVDPLAGRQLASGAVPLHRLLAAALRHLGRALAKLRDELLHPRTPLLERLVARDLGGEHRHRRREPSDLRCRTLPRPRCGTIDRDAGVPERGRSA